MAKKVLIEAATHEFVGYFDFAGRQIDRGYPLEERPDEPPVGTIYEREYTLLKDVVTEDGEPIERLDGFPLKVGPRKFLRGRLVTDKKEAAKLLMPPLLRELVAQLRASGADVDVDCLNEVIPSAVAITMADGTEVGIALKDGDIPPPKGASTYPVGESPEERRMAEMVATATVVDGELDEVEEIREDVKNGVFDHLA